MNLWRYVLPVLLTVGIASTPVFALDRERLEVDPDQETPFQKELSEKDSPIVKDFLRTKRRVDLQDKSKLLRISGDVRFEWQHLNERGIEVERIGGTDADPELIGVYQVLRGRDAFDLNHVPVSRNDFDVEFNLKIDYSYERSWAAAHLQFDNGAGTGAFGLLCVDDPIGCHGAGECSDICLKRAYIGYNVCHSDCVRFDVELGRRKLYDIFDSYIEFQSRFDGLLLKYTNSCYDIGDFYWYAGAFIVDERVNHYSYVTELGLLNIYDTGIDLKYSLIHWPKYGRNRCCVENPEGWRFIVSQITAYYNFDRDWFCTPGKFYGAFLINSYGQRFQLMDPELPFGLVNKHRHANMGWYIGFYLGEVLGEGDWAIDITYEVVQARAMPDCDMAGIGRGNILDESFTEIQRGNTNFEGVRAEFLYALTDNLTFDTIFEYSHAYDDAIGGKHKYTNFEIEAIYAF